MTANRFSFFSNAAKYIKIEPNKFLQAIRSGDSAAIDGMLELKKQGAELDLNNYCYEDNPLKILLQRKDFDNANKLLKSGANTTYYTKEYFGDSWGEWDFISHDLFKEFAGSDDVIECLRKESQRQSFDKLKKEYENAKEFVNNYQHLLGKVTTNLSEAEVGTATYKP